MPTHPRDATVLAARLAQAIEALDAAERAAKEIDKELWLGITNARYFAETVAQRRLDQLAREGKVTL